MSKHNPSLPREIEVSVGGETIVVRKLPLGRVAQLAQLLDSLPDVITAVTGDDELVAMFNEAMAGKGEAQDFQALGKAVVTVLPRLLATAQDFVVRLIAVGAELDRKWVEENVGLDEALELLVAIFTVNNLSAIQKHGKNLMRLFGLEGKMVARQATARTTAVVH